MRKSVFYALFTSTFMVLAGLVIPSGSPGIGPREDDLIIYYYTDVESAYAALKAGEVDVVGSPITGDLYADAVTDPNIVLGSVAHQRMYQLYLNSNCTIESYSGIESPMHFLGFRQAIAFLTDKDYVVETICGGFAERYSGAERIDQPIAAPQKGWKNSSMWVPDYPYEYDPLAAAATLDSAGFVQGLTPNPYYDSAFSGSAEYIRTYPLGHSKAGMNLDPLEVAVRVDDLRRYETGTLVYGNLRKHGIPVNPVLDDWSTLYQKVSIDRDYHIYTGALYVGTLPPPYLYNSYHSSFWVPQFPQIVPSNIVTGEECDGVTPNYPQLDQLLEDAVYASGHEESVAATKKALGYFTEQCITIPLWSDVSYFAWSKDLLGVVNMEGTGIENSYTFMNAFKADQSPIRFACKQQPSSLNIIYADTSYDFQSLDRMNLYGFLDTPPYDLSTYQPGFVQNWTQGQWDDGGETKTKVSRTFRSDNYFAEPVTGNQKANVNATHYYFSAWYMYQTDSPARYYFDDLHHIDITGSHQVDIYADTNSYWNIFYAAGPFLPIDTWLQHPTLVNQTSESFQEGTSLSTPGSVSLNHPPVYVKSLTANGTPLEEFVDYNIVKGELHIFLELDNGTAVVVDYCSPGDPQGYTPGGLPWEIVFEAAGMYYATSYTPPGGLTLKRNPYYWMETPPLGEIDFKVHSDGCFKVDIYDVVMAAEAYGSEATLVPSPTWAPWADLAPAGGVVDIYDIVTLTAEYGTEWGCPP